MSLTYDDIKLGDTVRMRGGEEFTVGSKSTSFGDRTGEYEGPFISPERGFGTHYLINEVKEVIARNPRLCVYCGEGVTAKSTETNFCVNCFYSGAHDEHEHAALISALEELDNVKDAGIWHTGGGCMLLAVRLVDGRLATCTEWDAQIPNPGDPWGMIYVHPNEESYDEQEYENVEEHLFHDWDSDDKSRMLSDAQLVDFVRRLSRPALTEGGLAWVEAHPDSIVARVAATGYNTDWPEAYVTAAIAACNAKGASS